MSESVGAILDATQDPEWSKTAMPRMSCCPSVDTAREYESGEEEGPEVTSRSGSRDETRLWS
mgnify:CR=1 FL=1|jgi:hypothetical protein